MRTDRNAARYSNTKTAIKQKLNADYIKETLAARDFYGHTLTGASFKKLSWNDGGLCPFHSDNTTGSFRVNLATGAYKCFACGAAGADIIAFSMAFFGLEFFEALAKLADDWGLKW